MTEWLTSVRLRLQGLLRRRQLEQDLQDEMAFHLAMREEQLRASDDRHARTHARRQFGSVEKVREELRDAWALAPALGYLLHDFRYAARTLRRSPGFTAVVVLTLTLGIGANTAFFSVVNAALIRPLGFANADRLVSVYEGFPQAGIDRFPFSAPDYEDFRTSQSFFEAVSAYKNGTFELSGDGEPERIVAAKITADLFQTVGVAPQAGRSFLPEEDRAGVRLAVLSADFWTRRYGANPSVLGRTIQLDREPYTIVGIMPSGFVFPRPGPQANSRPADVWVPMAFTPRERAERAAMHNNSVIARLRDGATLQEASAELDVLAARIAGNYPAVLLNAGVAPRLTARPLREEISGDLEAPLLWLLGAAGLVLLVACANVANLILSRAAGRTREFAIRLSLGAGRWPLVRLLLCEACLLSLLGAAAGIAVAYWAIGAVPAVVARTVPGLHDVTLDVRVLAFTGAIGISTAVLFGLLPLATLTKGPTSLQAATPCLHAPRKLWLQRALVVATVSLAVVLLVGAGLFVRSFTALLATDLGFHPGQVIAASMTLPRTAYTSPDSVRAFHASLHARLSALPGVRSAALATNLPFTLYDRRAFTPEGVGLPDGAQPMANITWVHGPYLETMGMTIRRGRSFAADEHLRDRGVVIVNEKLAELYWPGQNPVGKRLKWGIATSQFPWLTVVGVVPDVADGPVGTEPGVHAYEPFRQFPEFFLEGAINEFGRDVKAAVLAEGEPQALVGLVRKAIAEVDPSLAVQSVEPMTQHVRDAVAPQRAGTHLVGAFGAIALLLASVGLYGLLAYTTRQRRREIAIRMALGARPREVVRLVIGHGARLVTAGLAAGLLGSVALARLVESLLYRTRPLDPVTFATAPVVLAAVALVACALPAWRAARVEPTTVLRAE